MAKTAPDEHRPERKDYLTARQLATVLQVSEATVRRLAHKGRIPCIRLTPRLLRFHLAAVRHALDVASRSSSQGNSSETSPNDAQLSFDDLL